MIRIVKKSYLSLQRRQILRNSLRVLGSSDSSPGRQSFISPSWCDACSAVWVLPWCVLRACSSPGSALLLWAGFGSTGQSLVSCALVSCAPSPGVPAGSVPASRGSEAAPPRLSRSIILLCSAACMGPALHFRAECSPGGRVYDDAVGQKVSKALGRRFTKQGSDRSASCTDRFDTQLLTKT